MDWTRSTMLFGVTLGVLLVSSPMVAQTSEDAAPMRTSDGQPDCHEGNIGLEGILAGARVQEAKGIPLRR